MKPFALNSFMAIGLLSFIVGCGAKSTTTSYSTIKWRSQGENPVPGIDHAAVFSTVANGEVMFVVWTDIDPAHGGFGWGGSRSGPSEGVMKYSGSIRQGEMFIPILWKMKDDETGTVAVSGSEFEMEDGNWFLVSTQTTPVTVKQIAAKSGKRQLSEEEFKQLAQTNDDIAGFFNKAAEQE